MTVVPDPAALTCSAQAQLADEPLRGTAPDAVGWFLVEQAGPWGHDAVTESGLDPLVAAELTRRTADIPVRAQLIRRPGHRRGVQRTVILAHAGPERTWMRRLAVQDPRRILDVDPQLLLSPVEPELGEPEPGPVLLVCTHAKRDQCCALWGRPLVAGLAERHPEAVWESSHVGGHRFAGNLVVLPHGNVHGYLDVEAGVRVVDRYLAGEVDVATLRGRSSLPPAGQAAEVFVREHAGVDDLDALRVTDVVGGDEAEVHVELAGRRFVVHVEARPLGAELLTGCDKPAPKDPGTYRLVSAHGALTGPAHPRRLAQVSAGSTVSLPVPSRVATRCAWVAAVRLVWNHSGRTGVRNGPRTTVFATSSRR